MAVPKLGSFTFELKLYNLYKKNEQAKRTVRSEQMRRYIRHQKLDIYSYIIHYCTIRTAASAPGVTGSVCNLYTIFLGTVQGQSGYFALLPPDWLHTGPDLPHSPTPPPLPQVSYSWDGASTTSTPLSSYSRSIGLNILYFPYPV